MNRIAKDFRLQSTSRDFVNRHALQCWRIGHYEVIKCFPTANPFNFGETGQLPFSIISRDRMHVVRSESLLNLNLFTSVNVCFWTTKRVPTPIAVSSAVHTIPNLSRTGSCTWILLKALCGLLVCLVVVQPCDGLPVTVISYTANKAKSSWGTTNRNKKLVFLTERIKHTFPVHWRT
jgi:hypothetical protein